MFNIFSKKKKNQAPQLPQLNDVNTAQEGASALEKEKEIQYSAGNTPLTNAKTDQQLNAQAKMPDPSVNSSDQATQPAPQPVLPNMPKLDRSEEPVQPNLPNMNMPNADKATQPADSTPMPNMPDMSQNQPASVQNTQVSDSTQDQVKTGSQPNLNSGGAIADYEEESTSNLQQSTEPSADASDEVQYEPAQQEQATTTQENPIEKKYANVKLTPMDIYNKKFKKKGRYGYDAQQVDDFLDLVVQKYADALDENSDLKNKNLQLQNKNKDLKHDIAFVQEELSGMQDNYQKEVEKSNKLEEKLKTKPKTVPAANVDMDEKKAEVNEIIAKAHAYAAKIKEKARASVNTNTNSQPSADESEYYKQKVNILKSNISNLKQRVSEYSNNIQQSLQDEINNLSDSLPKKTINNKPAVNQNSETQDTSHHMNIDSDSLNGVVSEDKPKNDDAQQTTSLSDLIDQTPSF